MPFEFLNSFLFHPRKSSLPITKKDVLIKIDDDITIGSRFHLTKTNAPNIIFFHGNGEIAPEYDDISALYNQRNINFIPVDYRGYGHSSGVPNPENILDVSIMRFDSSLPSTKSATNKVHKAIIDTISYLHFPQTNKMKVNIIMKNIAI